MTIEGINKDQFHDIIHNKIRKKTEHTCLVKLRQNKKIETHSGIIETDLFYLSTKKIIDIPRFRLLEEKIWILDAKYYDENYYENFKKQSEKEIKQSFLSDAKKRVKNFLILREISKREKITVSEEEIRNETAMMLKHYSDAEKAEKGLDPERLKAYAELVIRNKKTFQLLENSVK